MTEQIKYEAVFGDQNLFIHAPTDAIVARYGKDFYKYESEVTLTTGELRDEPIVAMRRIIRTPVWTVEDKKEGRLPEVGAKCRHGRKEETVIAVTENFVVTECLDGAVCTTRKFEFMASYNPVETPEEKAARLSEEWVDNATFMTTYEIYDALLSGELTMPGKDDEDHR